MINVISCLLFAMVGVTLWLKMWRYDTEAIDNVWKEIIHTIIYGIVRVIRLFVLLFHEYVNALMKGGDMERKFQKKADR